MPFRFLHAADIHLGYEQYNLLARADDFAAAYMALVDHAVNQRVDFVLLAGDLFHRASADAWMLRQATAGLEALRQAGIPVIAVEGNHDAQHARKHLSWMEFLCDQGLLVLLNVLVGANGSKSLAPWNAESRRGSWVDIAGARIYGMKYYGAMTGRIVAEIAGDVEPGPGGYTMFMAHAGMQGQVPHMHGGLTPGELMPLRPPVDYLALGHVHKRLEMEDWIFNPGSTETNSMEEMEWAHGFFDVSVDPSSDPKHLVTYVNTPHLRPFCRISVSAEDVPNLEQFVRLAEEQIATHPPIPEGAVVELYMGGVAQFKRQDVPVDALRAAVQLRFHPLTVRVRNTLVPPGDVTVRHGERMRRGELEQQIIEHMVYQQGDYRDRAAAWTKLILEVKSMAVEGDLPASIVDHVQAALDRMEQTDMEQTEMEEEPQGGEAPCLANLFPEW